MSCNTPNKQDEESSPTAMMYTPQSTKSSAETTSLNRFTSFTVAKIAHILNSTAQDQNFMKKENYVIN